MLVVIELYHILFPKYKFYVHPDTDFWFLGVQLWSNACLPNWQKLPKNIYLVWYAINLFLYCHFWSCMGTLYMWFL